MRRITEEIVKLYWEYLIDAEKSNATIEKYIRDVRALKDWFKDRSVDKSVVLSYKSYLVDNYNPASINSVLSSLNSFFLI